MRNPYLLDARYKKQYHPQFAGGKYYVALLSGDGYVKLARSIFKRASEAEAYAIRLRGRWMRLYDAAVVDGGGHEDANLLLLCEQCHADIHGYKKRKYLDPHRKNWKPS